MKSVNLRQAMTALHCSRRTIYHMLADGRLHRAASLGRDARIEVPPCDHWPDLLQRGPKPKEETPWNLYSGS